MNKQGLREELETGTIDLAGWQVERITTLVDRYVAELIGQDEPMEEADLDDYPKALPVTSRNRRADTRNQLRAELRKKAGINKTTTGGEDM